MRCGAIARLRIQLSKTALDEATQVIAQDSAILRRGEAELLDHQSITGPSAGSEGESSSARAFSDISLAAEVCGRILSRMLSMVARSCSSSRTSALASGCSKRA